VNDDSKGMAVTWVPQNQHEYDSLVKIEAFTRFSNSGTEELVK
jgi:hypothetical protein